MSTLTDRRKSSIDEYLKSIINLPFISTNIDGIYKKKIVTLDMNTERAEVIHKFADILKDIELALKLEAGIFEFTIIYGDMENHAESTWVNIYNDKFNDIVQNINGNKHINNKKLKGRLINREIDAQRIAFMKPYETHPERWETVLRKRDIKEDKKKNLATTDAYVCRNCKERKCRMIELQTRSSDEPMTQFITCLNCYHVMKR